MTNNLPIVRTEFANRMRRAMFDFAATINASTIGMTEALWWAKFYEWNSWRLTNKQRNRGIEKWK